jgi:hypothetical protein
MVVLSEQNLVILRSLDLMVKNKIFTQNHAAVTIEIICHLGIALV